MFPSHDFLNLYIKIEVLLIIFMVAFVHFACTYKEKTRKIPQFKAEFGRILVAVVTGKPL